MPELGRNGQICLAAESQEVPRGALGGDRNGRKKDENQRKQDEDAEAETTHMHAPESPVSQSPAEEPPPKPALSLPGVS